MPVYEFKCKTCELGLQSMRDLGDTTPPSCPDCGEMTKRVFSIFTARNSMPEHFNHSTGTYVSNEKQLKDDFKRLSEETSLRTNLDHRFVPHDPREMKDELGVTDEGMEETYRRQSERDPALARRMKREGVWV